MRCNRTQSAGTSERRRSLSALTIAAMLVSLALASGSGSGAGKKAPAAAAAKAKTNAASRAKKNGAIRGAVEVALIWDGLNDLDLAIIAPGGTRIDANSRSGAGGRLDLDFNYTPMDTIGLMRAKAGLAVDESNIVPIEEAEASQWGRYSKEPIEHVFWGAGRAPEGTFKIMVQQFYNREKSRSTPYSVVVTIDGKVVATFEGKFNSKDVITQGEDEAFAGSFKYPFPTGGER